MTSPGKPIRIGVVEHQAMVRQCLVSYLGTTLGLEIVFEAKNGEEAIRKTRKYNPDVIITEVRMPRMWGDTAAQYIRAKFPQVKILVLTNENDQHSITTLVAKGCHGYILKSEPMAELINAIYNIVARDFYYNKQVSRGFRSKVLEQNVLVPKVKNVNITKREKQIMVCICNQMTAHEIARKLCISSRTVERHYENMFVKTGQKNLVGLALYAKSNRIA